MMKVIDTYDKSYCDNCGQWVYVFDIVTDKDAHAMTLCKDCLLELMKGIIER